MPHPQPPARNPRRRPLPSVDELVAGITAGDRGMLARAITLVESTRPDHRAQASTVLERLLDRTGSAWRVGITGVPGVGKSTFIEAFGSMLTGRGHQVAVLAIDPSSRRHGGSILGDKTRMAELSVDPKAFVRPSPAGESLGGVARKTRETMLLCEAAGYDVVLIETVGVGQSETVASEMVDFFLVLMLAGAGDELQGIKRGVLEIADAIAVNKADGDNAKACIKARQDYANALRVMHDGTGPWTPTAVTCSGLGGIGLTEIWELIADHRQALEAAGQFSARRADQQVRWLWSLIDEALAERFRTHPEVAALLPQLEAGVRGGTDEAGRAAAKLLDAFGTG